MFCFFQDSPTQLHSDSQTFALEEFTMDWENKACDTLDENWETDSEYELEENLNIKQKVNEKATGSSQKKSKKNAFLIMMKYKRKLSKKKNKLRTTSKLNLEEQAKENLQRLRAMMKIGHVFHCNKEKCNFRTASRLKAKLHKCGRKKYVWKKNRGTFFFSRNNDTIFCSFSVTSFPCLYFWAKKEVVPS